MNELAAFRAFAKYVRDESCGGCGWSDGKRPRHTRLCPALRAERILEKFPEPKLDQNIPVRIRLNPRRRS